MQTEITTVVVLKKGIPEVVKSFLDPIDAEKFFTEKAKEYISGIDDEDIENSLDNGYIDGMDGENFRDIYIMQNDLIAGRKVKHSFERLSERRAEMGNEHAGREATVFNYWAGRELGYLSGKIAAYEDMFDINDTPQSPSVFLDQKTSADEVLNSQHQPLFDDSNDDNSMHPRVKIME